MYVFIKRSLFLLSVLSSFCLLLQACSNTPAQNVHEHHHDSGQSQETSNATESTADTTPQESTKESTPPDASGPESQTDAGQIPEASSPKHGKWLPMKAPPLGARQENSVVAMDGKLYIIAGFNGNRRLVASVEVYDPKADKWGKIADLPQAMHHTNAAAANGKIYVLGFLKSFLFTADGTSLVYDPKTDKWSNIKSMPSGRERGAGSVGVIEGKIYVAGGFRRGKAVSDFSVYDPKTDAWEKLPDLPDTLDHSAAGVIDGMFYLVGGRHAKITSQQDKLYVYNPKTKQWKTLKPIPTARGGIAGAVHGGRLYVFGGEGNRKLKSGVFDNVESYDPKTDTWTTHPPMKNPRHGTGAATIGNRIYIPVGADIQAFGAVKTCEIYDLSP